MLIAGLQKLTLLDYPGKVACTVFLGGCDFRCPFCHNSELLTGDTPPVMDRMALLSFLEKRRGVLEAVCISGGEPTLAPGLEALLREIRAMGYCVKLDTNGARPGALRRLTAEGLIDYAAMDIKNSPRRYAQTAGLARLELGPIEESIAFLMGGALDYEFRTTVVQEFHDEDCFREIGEMLRQLGGGRRARRYFLQPFQDRETVPFANLHAPDREEMEAYARILRPCVDRVEIRGE